MPFYFQAILIAFCAVGGILAIIELLTVVLACCYAQQISRMENDDYWEDVDYNPVHNHEGYAGGGYSHQNQISRPSTPGTPRSNRPCDDASSQHETAF